MSSVESLGGLQRRLHASIPQQQLRGAVEAKLKRLGRTAKVPGFRPGKVPMKILEQQYGAEAQREVLGDVLHNAFIEQIAANNLDVAGYPQFELKTRDLSAPEIEYSATFEVYPEVKLGDLAQQQVVRATFTLSDADVEKTLATIRRQRATYVTVSRAAQNEDQVRIDFSGTLNGEPFEGGQAKDYRVVLGAGRMLPEFEQSILGMQAGERKTFDMTFPADYHGKDVAGKQVTFALTVLEVQEPRLPEIDAAFAISLGVADGNVDKLKEEIRHNLQREAERRLKARNKDAAMEVLFQIGELEVPRSLVEMEAQRLMQQSRADMEQHGIKLPEGMQLPLDVFTERATKRVKLGLILAELVKQHGLTPKPEQVDALLKSYAESYQSPEEVILWYRSDANRMRELENLALEDNVVAWVMAGAKVTEQALSFDELMESKG